MGGDNPSRAFSYEFGGPAGTVATMVVLPIIVMLLVHWSDVGYVDLSVLTGLFSAQYDSNGDEMRFWDKILASPVFFPACQTNEQIRSTLVPCALGLLAWFGFQVLLERTLPGEVVEGLPVKGNKDLRLKYSINGHLSFWVTMTVCQCGWPEWHEESGTYQFTSFPLTEILYDNYAPLAFMAIVWSTLLAAYLYVSSFVGDKILADGGNSGNPFYDFFMGRELNPRGLMGTFDWKEFCELRPGLVLWMILNISCMQEQRRQLGYVSGSMLLVNLFQAVYVWDAQFQERAILSTMDITTDGFGFMLAFGDLAWVPFTYGVQARYLVKHDPELSVYALAAILLLHFLGYCVFRGANGQKNTFRNDPNHPSVKHLQYMQTKRGTKLLTSGWWGMARKINYTGDWIMGLTWCLVCGFGSIVPYYYAIYFAVLLIHRSTRDDEICHAKYGDDWLEYKQRVPYRFVPGVV